MNLYDFVTRIQTIIQQYDLNYEEASEINVVIYDNATQKEKDILGAAVDSQPLEQLKVIIYPDVK